MVAAVLTLIYCKYKCTRMINLAVFDVEGLICIYTYIYILIHMYWDDQTKMILFMNS